MAERNGLLNRRRGNLAGGSNPPLSANIFKELRREALPRAACFLSPPLCGFCAGFVSITLTWRVFFAFRHPRRRRVSSPAGEVVGRCEAPRRRSQLPPPFAELDRLRFAGDRPFASGALRRLDLGETRRRIHL